MKWIWFKDRMPPLGKYYCRRGIEPFIAVINHSDLHKGARYFQGCEWLSEETEEPSFTLEDMELCFTAGRDYEHFAAGEQPTYEQYMKQTFNLDI